VKNFYIPQATEAIAATGDRILTRRWKVLGNPAGAIVVETVAVAVPRDDGESLATLVRGDGGHRADLRPGPDATLERPGQYLTCAIVLEETVVV
jgi:hypothetical protein